jgi:hypothetical protein
MDSIEERYCTLKSITGIALVMGLMIAFGSLLSRESLEIENQLKKMMKRRR